MSKLYTSSGLVLAAAGLALVTQCGRPSPDQDTCGAAEYRYLVGLSIAAVSLPESAALRVIGPNDLVTYDFVATRVNIEFDTRGRIVEVRCG